jgi:hypothetical protein
MVAAAVAATVAVAVAATVAVARDNGLFSVALRRAVQLPGTVPEDC